ncbi:MAG: hypothetical protein LQ342_007303 [Letrouitia transgressa]|nr:MAG: hypothetical protein LQ342_007303 [Letrouitia transgressa]
MIMTEGKRSEGFFPHYEDEAEVLIRDTDSTSTCERHEVVQRPQKMLVALTQLVYFEASGLDAFDNDFRTVRFRGSFGLPSPYKGPPSPDVEAK